VINTTNRSFIYFFSVLFFLATGCYAYWQEFYFLAAPIVLIAVVFLIQYPTYILYLLMLSIPWSVEFNFNPTLGTDLPDEPLMLLGSLAVIIYLVHQWKAIQFKKLHLLFIIISLQFLWAIVTVSTSTDVALSIKYLLAKGWYLLAFVALPILLFKDEKVFRRSILLLLCSMLAVTVVIVIRHSLYGWTFEKVNNAVRPFFRNHVNYSTLLIFMVPLQIVIVQLSISKKIRTFFYCLLTITVVAVYFSYARGAWLALVAGLATYWLLEKKLLLLSLLLFFSLIIGSVFWLQSNDRFVQLSNDYKSTIYHSNFEEHMIATYQLKDLSNAERIYRWVAGVRMIKDNWETGFGPSTFYREYKRYTLPAFKTYVSDNREQSTVHNYFLLMLIEQGVIGCLLFVVLLVALLWYAQKIYCRTYEKFWKAVAAAAASILVMQCVINSLSDMIETDKVGSIFYLCVATIIIADIKTRKLKSDLSPDIQGIS
jgi:O-antigen ligase